MAKTPTWEEWFSAVYQGKLAVVAAGLDAGFSPDACAPPGSRVEDTQTPLQRAMGNTKTKKVALLLIERGANPNVRDEYGMTPLMWAASYADIAFIDALFKAGADPHAKLVKRGSLSVKDGSTALEIAVADGKKKAAQLLQTLMSGKTGKTTSSQSPFEQKLSALREAAFSVIDFEGSEEAVDQALVGVDRPGCFHTIGKSGSDSVFAFWTRKPGAPLETAPIVYLDSEGDPRAVVAKSMDEFLSILPYGTGTLYDLLSNPKRKFAAKDALEEAGGSEEDVDEQPFLKWWKSTFGVAHAKDPRTVLAAAAKDTKAFQGWLEQ